MAVDSRDKRASVLGVAFVAGLTLPSPGTVDQADRQHVAYAYRGITSAAAAPMVPLHTLVVPYQARTFVVPYQPRTFVVPGVG